MVMVMAMTKEARSMGSRKKRKKDHNPTDAERTISMPGVDLREQAPPTLWSGTLIDRVAEHWDNSDDLTRCDHYALIDKERALCGAMLDRREKSHLTKNVCQACRAEAGSMGAILR